MLHRVGLLDLSRPFIILGHSHSLFYVFLASRLQINFIFERCFDFKLIIIIIYSFILPITLTLPFNTNLGQLWLLLTE